MDKIKITTKSHTDFVDITDEVQKTLLKSDMTDGVVFLYCPHTTAGLTINEGADPDVKRDILAVLNSVIPERFDYRHSEGNSPAHIKASLMGTGVCVIIENQRLCLGTWQRIFFCEFDGPRQRTVWVKSV